MKSIDQLADSQDGAITRAQVLALNGSPDWISRQVGTRRWQRVFPGVYVVYTGRLSWRSRARAALLYAGPDAALSHASSAFHRGLVDRPGTVIHISLPHGRKVRPQPGLRVRRRKRMPISGGRLRAVNTIDTVLDVADSVEADEDLVVSIVCSALQHNTDIEQLRRAVRTRARLRRRRLMLELLEVIAEGVESALEYRYHRIERLHGLPVSRLQVRQVLDGLWLRADCIYPGLLVRVELDGQLAHPFGRTDNDVWRDNAVSISTSELTLRYRWRHVVVTPCLVARQVAIALRSRGWQDTPRPCGPGCAVGGLLAGTSWRATSHY
ncbi:type IV toxin-antitoxin system AbiEi family antitoxin domain-containing protein [Georgenia yuyongxinii]